MFGRKKSKAASPADYDRINEKPVIHASICTGEQVAGFQNIHTGKFTEVMLIKNDSDLRTFADRYQIAASEITKKY